MGTLGRFACLATWSLVLIAICRLLNFLMTVPQYFHKTRPVVNISRSTSQPLLTGGPSVGAPMVIAVCEAAGDNNYSLVNNASTLEEAQQYTNHLRTLWARQAEQLTTMLKTLLYFSKADKWRIIVMTDALTTFHKVLKLTRTFPEDQKRRLELQHENVWFPDNFPGIKEHWRPCVWAKQFLAEALPHEDAVVYFDTDVVFLGPGEEVWWLLRRMEASQAVALAPEPQYTLDDPRRPYAGSVGLNTGVMAVNLTRLRQLPGGGLGSAILLEGAIDPPPRHDQDALNHFLINKPHLVQEVTSRWNFIPSSCFSVAPPCPDCLSSGILVLHGADMTFYRNVEIKFLVMYGILSRLQLDDDPRRLLARVNEQLAVRDSWTPLFPCSNYTNLTQALTLGLTDAASLTPLTLHQ
ncbi:glucoside xylosyltransferase 2 [Procambarus clarkii]|uniref:glucoside xylosyltransferase 2 n=1 Tax=Procambarus clarkii TaxID=6728 RepID=UPI003743B3C0